MGVRFSNISINEDDVECGYLLESIYKNNFDSFII